MNVTSVGFANSGGLVFVDEPAEQIAATQVGGRRPRRWVWRDGREQLESAVWPVLVVVTAVDAEHMLEMAAAEDENPVEAVGADRASYPTLGEGVAFGAWAGVRITLMPSVRKTSSNARLNFVSRSWIKNRNGC
jgi:hypothetical protein